MHFVLHVLTENNITGINEHKHTFFFTTLPSHMHSHAHKLAHTKNNYLVNTTITNVKGKNNVAFL